MAREKIVFGLFLLCFVVGVQAQSKKYDKKSVPVRIDMVSVYFNSETKLFEINAKLYPQNESYANQEVSYMLKEKLPGLKPGSKGEGIIVIGEGRVANQLVIQKIDGKMIRPARKVFLKK